MTGYFRAVARTPDTSPTANGGQRLTSIREARRGVALCNVIQPILLPVGVGHQRLGRHIQIPLPAGRRVADVKQRMARGIILRLLNIDRGADEPVAGHPPLHQRSGGVTESMAAAFPPPSARWRAAGSRTGSGSAADSGLASGCANGTMTPTRRAPRTSSRCADASHRHGEREILLWAVIAARPRV